MGNYRNISLTFWTDPKVDDNFTPEDKYFYIYLITNPHTNICGCYEISMKQMERETGYSKDTIERLLHRMEIVHDVIRYNASTKEVLLLNWSKYNWSKSEKVKAAVLSVAQHLKHEPFKKYVIEKVASGTDNRIQITEYSKQKAVAEIDTDTVSVYTDVSIPYRYPIDTLSATPTIFTTYESTGRMLNSLTAEKLSQLAEEFTEDWVCKAIERANDRGTVNIGYITGILRSWQQNGGIDDPQHKASGTAQMLQDSYNMMAEWAAEND